MNSKGTVYKCSLWTFGFICLLERASGLLRFNYNILYTNVFMDTRVLFEFISDGFSTTKNTFSPRIRSNGRVFCYGFRLNRI